jgi:hypothetical protein
VLRAAGDPAGAEALLKSLYDRLATADPNPTDRGMSWNKA